MSGTSLAGGSTASGPAVRVGTADLAALAAGVVARGGLFQFHATGSSMMPVIRSGESVTLAACRFDALRPGDIIMTRTRSGIVFVHRVTGRCRHEGSPAVVTMGDNLPAADAPLTGDEIIGMVVGMSIGGRPVRFGTLPCQALGWLTAVTGRKRASLIAATGRRQWLRRLCTAGRILFRRLLRLYLRALSYAGGPGK